MSTPVFSQSLENFKNQRELDLKKFEHRQQKKQDALADEYDRKSIAKEIEFRDFVRKVENIWGEFESSNRRKWVSYSEKGDVIGTTDFSENGDQGGTIVVKTMVTIPPNERLGEGISPEVEKEMLEQALEKTVQKLKKIVSDKDVASGKYIFSDQIQEETGYQTVPIDSFLKHINQRVKRKTKTVKKIRKRKDGTRQREYHMKVKLIDGHIFKRSKVYLNGIREHAKKNNIPVSLVLAIIQTESYFNRYACSLPKGNRCLAYGLMQLVPKYAAREAYRTLYKKDRIPSGRYLFDSRNNITLGSVYIGKMVHRDLRSVNILEKRYLLATSSYNTGHGNTAKGLMKITNRRSKYPRPILKVIVRQANRLSYNELYHRLKAYLPYNETRHYIVRVTARRKAFKSLDQ
ncbi:MAG: transglycosylase SLT domain-containing protein [Proteobacteria bacterium]|nr:transglycosylase SLT domain-containing protein [Pseudomonadota bacterium]